MDDYIKSFSRLQAGLSPLKYERCSWHEFEADFDVHQEFVQLVGAAIKRSWPGRSSLLVVIGGLGQALSTWDQGFEIQRETPPSPPSPSLRPEHLGCWTPANNAPENLAAVDLDRPELRDLPERYLAVFLNHKKKHGKESYFQLNRETFASSPVQFVEEAQSLYRAVENKIRWDSQHSKFDHSPAEKHPIIDPKMGCRSCSRDRAMLSNDPLEGLFMSENASKVSPTPGEWRMFWKRWKFHTSALFRAACHFLCSPEMPREQFERLILEHLEHDMNFGNYNIIRMATKELKRNPLDYIASKLGFAPRMQPLTPEHQR
ncbi:uncharacterized protein LY89DRAFT_669392 [Mollisia scopiformis]|uniref:Uncharacterized protein n=1 Tax=Mollisia scopiformis TaxID=149040 RepID=A0A194X9W1_MOLSC|nr:uncharacterized protein LY89DRAFT_669392 [Mollisia scopiformis]KUJ16956.1 hypothetical protein LY89DRAFT_669392 [Mollisia scopiformis]